MQILNPPEKPATVEMHVLLSREEITQIIHDIETGDVQDRDLAYTATNEFMTYLRSL